MSSVRGEVSLDDLFAGVEVIMDDERFLIQATRLPWFKRSGTAAVSEMDAKVGK